MVQRTRHLVNNMSKRAWKKVVFSADCDEDGNCPVCGIDYADCGCPGPTMDGYDYKSVNGELYARASHERHDTRSARRQGAAPQDAGQGHTPRRQGTPMARATADGEGD
jgi:hypothetical protein